MTRIQALFILWLRHEKYNECSWRAVAANFYNRYDFITGKVKAMDDRMSFEVATVGGNQIDGIELCKTASMILFSEYRDLYDCDLYELNLKVK